MQVYERLGTDKPHRTEGAILNKEKAEEAVFRLSPTDAEEKQTQPTIDVHPGETQDNIFTAASAKVSAKNGRKKKSADDKPYAALYEADLKMNGGPTAWEIRDLRESVTGGEKSWMEEACCLICGAVID
jgi:hypothetical protein